MKTSDVIMDRIEVELLEKIANRAVLLAAEHDRVLSKSPLLVLLFQAHRAIPLRLDELAVGDDGNFAHDVFGIIRHFDLPNGRFNDCFVPRYARGRI